MSPRTRRRLGKHPGRQDCLWSVATLLPPKDRRSGGGPGSSAPRHEGCPTKLYERCPRTRHPQGRRSVQPMPESCFVAGRCPASPGRRASLSAWLSGARHIDGIAPSPGVRMTDHPLSTRSTRIRRIMFAGFSEKIKARRESAGHGGEEGRPPVDPRYGGTIRRTVGRNGRRRRRSGSEQKSYAPFNHEYWR